MSDSDVLEFIKKRLQERFDVKKLILFGSRAAGTAEPDSDYDVLVIAETNIPFIRRQGEAMMDLRGRGFAVDLLVYTPSEAEAAAAIPGTAVYWAQREGREYIA